MGLRGYRADAQPRRGARAAERHLSSPKSHLSAKPDEYDSSNKYSRSPFAVGDAEVFGAADLSRVSFFSNKGPGCAGTAAPRVLHPLPSRAVQLLQISLSPRLSCFHLN